MRAAFYECESTPPLGGFMWGHYKEVHAKDVKDRLYIKAGVFEENGEYAAIVTVDTCSLIPGIHKIVTDRIAQYTPIPASRVCISSNHTHSGAPICSDPSCGGKAGRSTRWFLVIPRWIWAPALCCVTEKPSVFLRKNLM